MAASHERNEGSTVFTRKHVVGFLATILAGALGTTPSLASTMSGLLTAECGDANDDGEITASDALIALATAVGTAECPPSRCDVRDDGGVSASDALVILTAAVGSPLELSCPPSPVTRETENSASATVGPAGGTITTTANDGTVYTMTIPEGSIPAATAITMTPISAIDGYPVASGVVGGVEVKPSGLVFTDPVVLEIETTKTPDTGSIPVAILFDGDAASFEPSLAGTGAGTFTVAMTHFSGGTVAFATAQELEALIAMPAQGGDCLLPAVSARYADPPDIASIHAVFRSCFQSEVLPVLEGAADDVQLASAIGRFLFWKVNARTALGPEQFATFDDAAETAQFYDLLVGKLQTAILRNNQRCEEEESLASLANVLFWQTQATRFGLDSAANLLDRATILRELCARVVLDQIVIPDNLTVGFPYSLDLQFGLLFDGAVESQGNPFSVQITGEGLDIQNPTGFTNAQGEYTTVVTATSDGVLRMTARGCLILPGAIEATDVCGDGTGQSEATDISGTWAGTVSLNGPSVPACAIISQSQNAISGTIHQAGGTASLGATLSGNQLLGVSVVGWFGEGECTTNGNGSVEGGTITMNVVPEEPCNAEITATYSFTRGSCP